MERRESMKIEQVFKTFDASVRKTKVICTLGPACWSEEGLGGLIDAGMNIARLNFSHGDHETHGKCIENLNKALASRPGKNVAVMLDTKGPEIRTGLLEDGKAIELIKDSIIKVTTDYEFKGNANAISCSYKGLTTGVQVGSMMLVADGSLTLEVTEIGADFVMAKCLNGCKLGEKKNMNLPGVVVDLPTLTPKDEEDLVKFGLKHKVDFIAASFVRKPSDLDYIRSILGPEGARIQIISKIENQEGLQNYDAILEKTDGIMVARGDLGMEIPPEKVFIAQKWMIEKANIAGKPVHTATQMLESMINAPRPTRAEASDVANAVLDGTDCVMLSGESANGAYPVNAVTIMAKCSIEAEQSLSYSRLLQDIIVLQKEQGKEQSTADAVAQSAAQQALNCNLKAIIVQTKTGAIAQLLAKYRPSVKIIAGTDDDVTYRQFSTVRGVEGIKLDALSIEAVLAAAIKANHIKAGDKIGVITSIDNDSVDEPSVFKVATA